MESMASPVRDGFSEAAAVILPGVRDLRAEFS